MKNENLPVKHGLASVAEVISRAEGPTTSKLFWSTIPGKVPDAYSGNIVTELQAPANIFRTPFEWYQTLLPVIQEMSMNLHRKNLRQPATFVVVNKDIQCILECLTTFKPFLENFDNPVGPFFIDATFVGTLNTKFSIFLSEEMPANQILVGCFGDGIECKIVDKEIDVVVTENPLLFRGEVSWWGFVELKDM